jgi:hypothetical protein
LREGSKTVSDLQAYLETSAKYKNEYGKDSLGRYRKLLFEAEMAKDHKPLNRDRVKEQIKKSQERKTASNEKIRRRYHT